MLASAAIAVVVDGLISPINIRINLSHMFALVGADRAPILRLKRCARDFNKPPLHATDSVTPILSILFYTSLDCSILLSQNKCYYASFFHFNKIILNTIMLWVGSNAVVNAKHQHGKHNNRSHFRVICSRSRQPN